MEVRRCVVVGLVLFVAGPVGIVQALPIEVPDFATDPSGLQFTIEPVPITDPGCINLAAEPNLYFGDISEPDGTTDVMRMEWSQDDPGMEAQAGWQLVFGEDPDLRGQQISLSINPPGGWTNAAGIPIPNPGNPAMGDLFQGITSLQVRALDINNVLAGGWGFNTDMAGLLPPMNDPLAAGLVSLQCNWMQVVTINVTAASPAAGDAVVSLGPGGPFIAPNFLIAGNGNWANIGTLQFFENGVLQGGVNLIPGQTNYPGINNYWDHITVTPEPTTLGLLMLGGFALLRRRRR